MSDLETIILLVALLLTARAWIPWFRNAVRTNPIALPKTVRAWLIVLPLACQLLVLVALVTLASHDVRTDHLYLGFYLVISWGFLGAAALLFPFLGISVRDDVLERGNRAALIAVGGALIGITLALSGANIGEGPGVEAVLLCAILSSSLFFVLWFLAELITSYSEKITVERDHSTSLRFAMFLVVLGLACGWSVAGNWVSVSATLRDFIHSAWIAVGIAVLAVILEKVLVRSASLNRRSELRS